MAWRIRIQVETDEPRLMGGTFEGEVTSEQPLIRSGEFVDRHALLCGLQTAGIEIADHIEGQLVERGVAHG